METSIVLKGRADHASNAMIFNDINLLFPPLDGGSKRQEDRDSYFFGFLMRKAEALDRAIIASLRFITVLDGKGRDSCFVTRTDFFSPTTET